MNDREKKIREIAVNIQDRCDDSSYSYAQDIIDIIDTPSSPHPEAREEAVSHNVDAIHFADILNSLEKYQEYFWHMEHRIPKHYKMAKVALSRLAARKDEGPSNSPETPDSSPRDCDTCIYWDDAQGCRAGVWIQCATGKNTAITGDYWLPATPRAPSRRGA